MIRDEEMRKRYPHGAVAWDYGTDGIYESKPDEVYRNTSYPASERCPELRQPELQRKPEATAKAVAITITRPKGMSPDKWHDYHCAELSRLRQERNRRGERYPLNRGQVFGDRVEILRG